MPSGAAALHPSTVPFLRAIMLAAAVLAFAVPGRAQQGGGAPPRGLVTAAELASARAVPASATRAPARVVRRPVDVRALASHATGRRLVISVAERRLRWMDGARTLLETPVAVGKGGSVALGARRWHFVTPRGMRRVLSKDTNPVWTPPDWHYVELARDSALRLVRLDPARPVRLPGGAQLVVRGDRIGRLLPGGRFDPVPADEEVVFGDVLYIPPLGTVNRRLVGELGAYKLELGDGYLIHGTPDARSIGRPTTHGCIRVPDAALRTLFRAVPVGTPVYIY